MGGNGLLERVEQAINRNATVKGLMNDFRDIGIKVNDELETIVLAEEFWWEINRRNNGSLLNHATPVEIKELPYTKAKIGNTAYYIHGIIHDGKKDKLSKRVRELISKQIAQYHNLKEGIDYLCEPGLAEKFNLPQEKEIHALLYYLRKLLTSLLKTAPIKKDYESCISLKERDYDFLYLYDNARKDIRYFPLFRDFYKKIVLPIPIRIDARKIKSEEQKRCYECYNKVGRISCSPDASFMMAGYLTKHAQKNNLSELHFLVGGGHEDEIIYYMGQNKQK